MAFAQFFRTEMKYGVGEQLERVLKRRMGSLVEKENGCAWLLFATVAILLTEPDAFFVLLRRSDLSCLSWGQGVFQGTLLLEKMITVILRNPRLKRLCFYCVVLI